MSNQTTIGGDPSVELVTLGGLGPRATQLSGDYPLSTLFVGLGQVGWQAVSLLSTMLHTTLPSNDISHVQYLAIARRPTVMPETKLARENTLLLTLDETDWAHIPGRYSGSGVARWWPKPPRDRSAMPDMIDIRAYGRLLLYDNPQVVNDTIVQRVQTLVKDSQKPGSDHRKLVVILCSIAEAEGSGMLFDVAWMLRLHLLEHDAQIVTILTADPGPISEERRTLAVANVYASLKELDALMVNPAQYPIGLPMTRATSRLQNGANTRPFDYLFITGDAAKPDNTPVPAAAIAEMAATWAYANTGGMVPDLAPMPYMVGKVERFDGYTTFNVSKLGLPVAAAVDLIGGNLAQQLLAGMTTTTIRDNDSINEWATVTLDSFKQALAFDKPYEEIKLQDRLSDLKRRATIEAINAEVRSKDKEFSMRAFAEALIKRLEHEDRATEMIDEGHTAIRLDTFRTRMEDAVRQRQAKLNKGTETLITQIACQQGNGLRWTYHALDQLGKLANETYNKCREQVSIADEVWHESRRTAFRMAQDHDESYNGIKRRLRGTVPKELQDLNIAFDYVVQCLAERIRWSNMAAAWQETWRLIDSLLEEVRGILAQAERISVSITEYAALARQSMDAAALQSPIFPAGTLVDGDWFQKGVAEAVPPNVSPKELISRVYRHWVHGSSQADRRADKFVRESLAASRQFLLGKFQFAPLHRYIVEHAASPTVQQGVVEFQKAAVPQMLPSRETTGWTTQEWLRATPPMHGLLQSGQGSPWKRLNILSPDADEMVMIRLTHRVTAESIPQLRGPYRRAYDRIAAEGVPLHLDRRWDTTMADLVKNTAQAEVSQLWETALEAASLGPSAIREPLINIIKLLAIALGIDPNSVQKMPATAPDFAMTIYPLPTFRLRLPPAQCPIVFIFSGRRPRELGQDIYQAVSSLGLAEPFLFIVNLNGRKDIDTVVEALGNESYNVVTLDEARFKRIVSSRKPLGAMGELVLSEVDLTLISPFYTKAPVPERMFYGREREIKDVRRKIKTHSVALIGGRRIGKTSMLHQLERMLKTPDSGYKPYYLDCHNAMQYSHFFNNIARRWEIDIPTPDPTSFEDIVRELRKRNPEQHIVFLFDEVDRLLLMDMEQKHNELLFRTFRALSNEGIAHFIFSGERWLARAMENSYSALFNFALPVRLQPLEKDVVSRLVVEPFEMMNLWLEDGPNLINRIYEISAGHPNICQMICQEVVVAVDEDRGGNVGLVNSSHLEHALDKHKLQEEIVQTIWGQMSDLARLITLMWPEDERSLSLDQIALKIRGIGLQAFTVRDLQEAMKDLELYCFVTPKGREYELVPVAFPALLDFMTVKQMEIAATIEGIQQKAKKEAINPR